MPDNDGLLAAINAAEETAYGSDETADLAQERAQAIDMYLGRNTMPAPDGRSQVVDRSLYETIQWIKPSLSRIFANGDDVVQLPPVGPEDEEGSKQESQYLNYLVLQKNNWFEIFDTACSDALLTKAAYLHPYIEKRRQIEMERYERQTPEGLALIMQDQPEILSQKEYPDPDYIPQPQQVMGPDGLPTVVIPPPPMLYDIEIRRTKTENHYCILVLPPERCKIAESTKTVQLTDCGYFEYFDFPTISDLRAEGYDVPDDIESGSNSDNSNIEEIARNQFQNQFSGLEEDWSNVNDPSLRKVKCRWVWIRYDFDEDGIAELQYCVVVGKQILYRQEVNRIPVAVLCPDPLPHRHVGLCPGDTVADIQAIKTDILRQGLDNLRLANNQRTFADPSMINLDDLMVSRPGGIVRGKPGSQFGVHIAPIPSQFMFPQALEGLSYMDQSQERRAGVSNLFTGVENDALDKTATEVKQLSTMAAQRVEQIARHFANGIEELFAILHELVLKAGHKKDVVKLRGNWVEVDPATWRSRTDFKISVGFAAGNKDAMMARLGVIATYQEKCLAGGLPVVTPDNVHNLLVEITKAADLSTPEKYWTNPKDIPPPPPPQPDPTIMAAEQMKTQSAERIKQADLTQAETESQRSTAFDKYRAELDAQTKLTIAQMQQQHDAEMERMRADHAAGMEGVRAHLNPKTKEADAKKSEVAQKDTLIQQLMESTAQHHAATREMVSQVLDAVQKMNGPKRAIRGKDGRIERVEPVQ